MMKLLVGLGNPGGKYEQTRHNIGFMALDAVAARHNAAPWRSKFHALLSTMTLGDEKHILLKPQTYMNDSGRAVQGAATFYKLRPRDIIIFHDELDLPAARLRVKTGGGHGGHNGLRSIHTHIGADYKRVRMGIGHPGHKDKVTRYVLHDFTKDEQLWLDVMLAAIATHIPSLLTGQDSRFASDIAQAIKSSKPKQDLSKAPTPPNAGIPPSLARLMQKFTR